MARTNLHELANRLLQELATSASDHRFEGKLREVANEAGLNSVRSAEAIKLLEELDRVDVLQRGRRGRDTVIEILSTDPVSLDDARAAMPSKSVKKSPRLNYNELGRAVVDRLIELGRNESLRAAQVEAFARENEQHKRRVAELEQSLESAEHRETDVRIRLKTAEEALQRAEENMRRALGGDGRKSDRPVAVEDDEARAVLDMLRSGRG